MKTFSQTTSSSMATGFDTYVSGKPIWHTTAGAVAQQGSYGGSDSYSRNFRIGIMFWSNMGATLQNKSIKSVKITCTFGNAGYGVSTYKNLRFYTSNYNYLDQTNLQPINYVGTLIQTFNTIAYSNTATFTFTTSGSGWTALCNSLKSGIGSLVVYNTDDKATSSGDIGNDYLQINTATIEVQYEDGTIWIHNGTQWVQAIPWIYNGTKWVQAIPWIYNGTKWKQCGG